MAMKKGFSCEFRMFFQAKNDQRKIANDNNQTYLQTLQKVWISLAINWNAFRMQEEDILTKRKRKERFDGDLLEEKMLTPW